MAPLDAPIRAPLQGMPQSANQRLVNCWIVAGYQTKKSDGDLKGLVYSLTPKVKDKEVAWYQRSSTLAIVVLTIGVILTILFW